MKIQLKRGTAQNRTSIIPDVAEPIMATDTKELFIGDGVTPGGFPVGTVKPTGAITNGAVAVFAGATGKLLAAISKADFLQGYATTDYVNQLVTGTTPGIKVKQAEKADLATNAQALNGHNDYIRANKVSDNYASIRLGDIASSKAVHSAYTAAYKLFEQLRGTVNTLSGKVGTLQNTVNAASSEASSANQTVAIANRNFRDHTNFAAGKFRALDSAVAKLAGLPNRISAGTGNPNGGSNGDVYIQYS